MTFYVPITLAVKNDVSGLIEWCIISILKLMTLNDFSEEDELRKFRALRESDYHMKHILANKDNFLPLSAMVEIEEQSRGKKWT